MPSCYDCSAVLFKILLLIGYFALCINLLIQNSKTPSDENLQRPEVSIPQGKIQGVNMVTRFKKKFFGFQGIPFAQPPVGNLRFKAPEPAVAWNGTFDGSIDSQPCPQFEGQTIIGEEDCLHLNVYTPRLPENENSTLLPVMMFVYGGAFVRGTNSPTRHSPQFILDDEVVLVAPNYRMGVLGYLSTGNEIAPGNYGLKDLVLALEWNRDNIRYFGGDPDRVTLVGQSSGGVSTQILTLSDLTKGLFHQYITQSGSALTFLACRPRKVIAESSTQLGKYLGCPTNSSRALVDCLRGFTASQLINTETAFQVWNIFPTVIWGPTIEPDIEGALLTKSPISLFAAGKNRDLPWLESVDRDEGTLLSRFFYERPNVYQEFIKDLDTLLPIILQYDTMVENVTMFTYALKSYFFNDLTADKSLLLANLTELIGDVFITYPVYSGAQQQLTRAKEPHYLCSFEYRGTVIKDSIWRDDPTTDRVVGHGDELLYLLPRKESFLRHSGWEFDEDDSKIVDTMVQLWTSFIINGTPTISKSNSSMVWEPYSTQRNYLQIGDGPDVILKIGYDLLQDRMRFWEELNATTSWRDY